MSIIFCLLYILFRWNMVVTDINGESQTGNHDVVVGDVSKDIEH